MALKNTINLNNLNQTELQSLREITSSHITMSKKFGDYASKVQDSQKKQMFSQASKDANTTATNLTNSL